MKVIFVQDTLINAGTEKSLLHIIPFFSSDIHLTVVYLYPRHDLIKEYESAKISTRFLSLSGKYDFWNGYNKIKNLLLEEQPDLVVSSLMRSNLLSRLACRSQGIPLIGTLVSDSYNDIVLKSKSFLQLYKFKFFWLLDRLTVGIPKFFIANSHFIAASHQITLGIPLEKTKVVFRGRSIPQRIWFKPSNSNFTFISFGRLLQTKGYEELIKAFCLINESYPQTRLIIYGDGNYRTTLERLICDLDLIGLVELPGVSEQVTEKLYSADCFVFPSWYEGFSGALVEAMMAGIPIIASDIPMNLEAITAEVNALTFPVRNVKVLSQKMEYALTHQQEMAELGKNARKEASNRFDIKIIAKQYESVLMEAYQKYASK